MPKKAGFVAVLGKPNAGKSTLTNRFVGRKLSIVTPKAQTTRKTVGAIYTDKDCQIVFEDVPGALERPQNLLHKSMLKYVADSIEKSDVLLILIDAPKFDDFESYFPDYFVEALKNASKPKIFAINKIDELKDVKETLPIIDELDASGLADAIVPISAVKGSGVPELLEEIKKRLPESEFFYDEDVLGYQTERFFVSEIVREKIFLLFRDEIPYSAEVVVTDFKERETGKIYIAADVVVERSSQKKILVGEKGSKIKRVGSLARKDIEEFLGAPVYLELYVKVRKNWRKNPSALRGFGYALDKDALD